MSMRVLIGSLLAAIAVAGADARAGQFVEIDSGAKAEPVRLIAYLARPPGAGPFSAVVLLHGCGGFHSSMKGHHAEFNEEATRDSIVRVRDFLQRTTGGQ